VPNGGKILTINGLERAVSTDINRLQLFAGKDRDEVLRNLMNVNMGSDDGQASSLNGQNATSTSPASAEVLNGLVVRPIAATLTCSIDRGALAVIAPDSDPDASNYKLVIDSVGVVSGSALVIAPNASGLIRVDVVECTYSVNVNAETDNRDIFNPATGAFAAVTVSKATQGILTYRIRSGTAGAGFPGTQTGYLPLCVVSVPSGAATVNDCTWWDVRPLVEDRVFAPSNLVSFLPRTRRNLLYIDTATTVGKALLSGSIETSASDPAFLTSTGLAGLYRLGGLYTATPIDLNLAVNQSGALSNGPAYVYIAEPFGLPRWSRYQLQSGALQPQCRGIAVVSSTAPGPFYGPSAALALPAATGLGGTTSKAVCVLVSSSATSLIAAASSDGVTQRCAVQPFAAAAGTVSGSNISWTMTPGTTHPATATALYVLIQVEYSVTGGSVGASFGPALLQTIAGGTPTTQSTQQLGVEIAPDITANAVWSYRVRVKIPVYPGANFTMQLALGTVTSATISTTLMQVDGWDA
jgi:hypothetical protein